MFDLNNNARPQLTFDLNSISYNQKCKNKLKYECWTPLEFHPSGWYAVSYEGECFAPWLYITKKNVHAPNPLTAPSLTASYSAHILWKLIIRWPNASALPRGRVRSTLHYPRNSNCILGTCLWSLNMSKIRSRRPSPREGTGGRKCSKSHNCSLFNENRNW